MTTGRINQISIVQPQRRLSFSYKKKTARAAALRGALGPSRKDSKKNIFQINAVGMRSRTRTKGPGALRFSIPLLGCFFSRLYS
jgi:hypothetical protein